MGNLEKKDKNILKGILGSCEYNGDSKVHVRYSNSETSRIYTKEPNIQNLKKRKNVRNIFVPESGYCFVGGDFSQIQIRIISHLAVRKGFDSGFYEHLKKGDDIHDITAKELGISRKDAKTFNFACCFGATSYGINKQFNSREFLDKHRSYSRFLRAWHNKYPEVFRLKSLYFDFQEENGYVSDFSGAKRFFDKRKILNQWVPFNSVIQMTESSIVKVAIVKFYKKMKELGIDCYLSIFVHDEIIFSVEEQHKEKAALILKDTMESAVSLKVPLRAVVAHGYNWYEIGSKC